MSQYLLSVWHDDNYGEIDLDNEEMQRGDDVERLDAYQPYHAARADLLRRASRSEEAVPAYDRALDLTANNAERQFLIDQRDGMTDR